MVDALQAFRHGGGPLQGRCNDFLADNGLEKGNPILVGGPRLYPQLAALALPRC